MCICLAAAVKAGRFFHGCDSRLDLFHVPRVTIGPLGSITPSKSSAALSPPKPPSPSAPPTEVTEAKVIMTHLLRSRGRQLTEEQWDLWTERAAKEPTVLYLQLSLHVVSAWTSSAVSDTLSLAGGVSDLTHQVLGAVEAQCGEPLTRAALGFITFAVCGISDSEMCDLLTIHENGMKAGMMKRAAIESESEREAVPLHHWLKVRRKLEDFLVEGDGETNCLTWGHRLIHETAAGRYADQRQQLHSTMAKYFGNLVSGACASKVRAQPLCLSKPLLSLCQAQESGTSSPSFSLACERGVWLDEATVNKRRCVEAAEHMLRAGMLPELVTEICALDSVCARARTNEYANLLRQLSELRVLGKRLPPQAKLRVEHYTRWLKQDRPFLLKFPQSNVVAMGHIQPQTSSVRADVLNLLATPSFNGTRSDFGADDWVRCVAVGGSINFEVSGDESTLQSHSKAVKCIHVSPDGRKIVSASDDRTARVWDFITGSLFHVLEGHERDVTCACFNPDGGKIATGSGDHTVRVWDAIRGESLMVLTGPTDIVTSVCFSPDGNKVISGWWYFKVVRLWDLNTGDLICELTGHTRDITAVSFSPDGGTIVSSSSDGTIRFWDAIKTVNPPTNPLALQDHLAELLFSTVRGHTDAITCVSFSADGLTVASGSLDKSVAVRDAQTFEMVALFKGHTAAVTCVAFHPSGAFVASGSQDATLRVWDIVRVEVRAVLRGHVDAVTSMAFHPLGKHIVTASEDHTVRVWDSVSMEK